MLYSICFSDGRERPWVVSVRAETPEKAVEKLIASWDRGFWPFAPDTRDVEEIYSDFEGGVQILWNLDYD